MPRVLRKLVLLLIPILAGAAGVVALVKSGSRPEVRPPSERSVAVRALPIALGDVVPRAIGYGIASPGRSWLAVAEVDGQVVEKSARMEPGSAVEEGHVLLEIDPRTYELKVAEAEAAIAKAQADLENLAAREENTEATLKLERRALELAQADYARKESLFEQGTISEVEFEEEERAWITQRTKTRELESALVLIPSERATLTAQLGSAQATLASERLRLSRTVITAPFTGRVVSADFEERQFVRAGEELGEVHGIDVAEIAARVSQGRMRHLLPTDWRSLPREDLISGDFLTKMGLTARVRLRSTELHTSWEARVARVETTLDADTRTIGVIAAVDEPYAKIIPGRRPPLVQGMFLEVELLGAPKTGRVLVPRLAVHGDEVFVAVDGRLARKRVKTSFLVRDAICVDEGLVDGDLVVLTDLSPAVEGLKLDVTVDDEVAARLARLATGEDEDR